MDDLIIDQTGISIVHPETSQYLEFQFTFAATAEHLAALKELHEVIGTTRFIDHMRFITHEMPNMFLALPDEDQAPPAPAA